MAKNKKKPSLNLTLYRKTFQNIFISADFQHLKKYFAIKNML